MKIAKKEEKKGNFLTGTFKEMMEKASVKHEMELANFKKEKIKEKQERIEEVK